MTTTAATTTISTDQEVMTLINVFTVEPDHQQELIDVLAEATTVMAEQPGFVSANLHRSVDGRRVVNYVQWRSRKDYDAMHANPQAVPHMRQAAELPPSTRSSATSPTHTTPDPAEPPPS